MLFVHIRNDHTRRKDVLPEELEKVLGEGRRKFKELGLEGRVREWYNKPQCVT
jgi:hypothetical protein